MQVSGLRLCDHRHLNINILYDQCLGQVDINADYDIVLSIE